MTNQDIQNKKQKKNSKTKIADKIPNKIINKILLASIFVVVSAAFLLFFSIYTSPLYGRIKGDAAAYWFMGKMMTQGKVPYIDFFDHKGPLLMLIQYMGNLINDGLIGIFIIQVVFFVISLMGIYHIMLLYFDNSKAMIITLLSLVIVGVYYPSGNMTEEYTMPFVVWSIYFAVKYLKQEIYEDKSHNIWWSFLYGVTFMSCCLIRTTNIMPVCSFVLVGIVALIKKKKWKNIVGNIATGLMGCFVVLIPFLIYYLKENALYEMFYATFLHNFMYVVNTDITLADTSITRIVYFQFVFFFCIIIAAISFLYSKKERFVSFCVMASSIIGIVTSLKMPYYFHYLYIWLPIIIVTLGLMKNIILCEKRWKVLALVSVGIFSVYVLLLNAYTINQNLDYKHSAQTDIEKIAAREIVSNIPEEDKNRICVYNMEATFYTDTDINSCYKYFFVQDLQSGSSKKLKDEFVGIMETKEAKYIITYKDKKNALDEFIRKEYNLDAQNEVYNLWKLKE